MEYRGKVSLSLLSCLAVLLAGIVQARGQSEHTAKLVEGAKKEGKLVWYTSMNLSESKPLLDAFEKKRPFVKAQLFRAGAERVTNRIITETRAGKWHFDVVGLNGVRINILVREKLIAPYVSPEAKAYNPKFKNKNGYWTGLYNNYYVPGYNTALVSDSEAPKDWEDLIDPKWKGKIAIDREEYPWYATLLAAWGEQKAHNYLTALAKQDIQWRRGHTLMAQLMAAGEFPVAIVYAHRIEEMKKKEAPLEWVNTVDPIVSSVIGVGVSAHANNPNTAKLFIDFVLSKEGQEMVRSFNRILKFPPFSGQVVKLQF